LGYSSLNPFLAETKIGPNVIRVFMKRVFSIVAILLLLVPTVTLAGSPTSRWGFTAGGFVKSDAGWADKTVGADYRIPSFIESSFMKGFTAVPEVRATRWLSKNFAVQVAATSAFPNQLRAGGTNVWTDSTLSLVPRFSGEVVYAPDALGEMGPFGLKMGLGGFVGKDTYGTCDYSTDEITTYASSFWWYVPIMRERQNNRAGAFAVSGNAFMGKGPGAYLPAYSGVLNNSKAHNRPTDSTVVNGVTVLNNVQQPTTYGAWAQATYYFTDKLFTSGLYGFQKNSISRIVSTANPDATDRLENYVVNLMYDVNPAMRFGLEYTRIRIHYGAARAATANTSALDGEGTINAVRFGAYYFF
jgi:hypothetical protein